MSKHVLLDNVTHKDLKILPGFQRGQGFDVSATQVFPAEFADVQMEYPIVLTKSSETGHFKPVALLGLGKEENLFLTERGWDAHYVPLTIERQPFLIGFQESMEGGVPQRQPVIHIDIEHPKVSMSEGTSVFLEHGGESPYLERMSSILRAIHEGNEANTVFSKLLVGLDLVESSAMEFTFSNGETQALTGLYIINEEKLRALNGDALESLHQAGFLQSIYLMLASMPNIRKLVNRKDAFLRGPDGG